MDVFVGEGFTHIDELLGLLPGVLQQRGLSPFTSGLIDIAKADDLRLR